MKRLIDWLYKRFGPDPRGWPISDGEITALLLAYLNASPDGIEKTAWVLRVFGRRGLEVLERAVLERS